MKGIYKNDNGTLLYAQEAVYYPNNEIIEVEHLEKTKTEIHGWMYFQTRQEALSYFNLTEEVINKLVLNNKTMIKTGFIQEVHPITSLSTAFTIENTNINL